MNRDDCFIYLNKLQTALTEFISLGLKIDKLCADYQTTDEKDLFYRTCISREKDILTNANSAIVELLKCEDWEQVVAQQGAIKDACRLCQNDESHWQNCEEALEEAVIQFESKTSSGTQQSSQQHTSAVDSINELHAKRRELTAQISKNCKNLNECLTTYKDEPPKNNCYEQHKESSYRDSEVVNVIARLQDSNSSGTPRTASGIRDFGRDVDNQLYASLGLPMERSQNTIKSRERIADQVLSGLSQSIEMRIEGEGQKFYFRPGKTIDSYSSELGAALGPQSLVKNTISSLRPTILDAVCQLSTQTLVESEFDIKEVYESIEEGLRDLENETGASEGVYHRWALLLLIQLAVDIRDYAFLKGLVDVDVKPLDDFIHDIQCGIENKIRPRCKSNRYEPCDIGLLVIDTNRQSVALLVSHLRTIHHAIESLISNNSGTLLARLRAVYSAIPPSVQAAMLALRHVQAAETDQTVIYIDAADHVGLSLRRLLVSIEAYARESGVALANIPDFGSRDLRRDRIKLRVYLDAVNVAIDTSYPQMTDNKFSSGRRQLVELANQMKLASSIMNRLASDPSHSAA